MGLSGPESEQLDSRQKVAWSRQKWSAKYQKSDNFF